MKKNEHPLPGLYSHIRKQAGNLKKTLLHKLRLPDLPACAKSGPAVLQPIAVLSSKFIC